MMVAEAEFAFKFARSLPKRANPYTQAEVLDAVESLHPAIEVPDSRYNDFATVGAPQLIADTACADWFVLGAPDSADWRSRDLVAHAVTAYRNGEQVGDRQRRQRARRSSHRAHVARQRAAHLRRRHRRRASSSRPAPASSRSRFSVATQFAPISGTGSGKCGVKLA